MKGDAAAGGSDGRRVLLGLAARAWTFHGRVLAALALLVAAKLAVVAVPLVLKRVVDALGRPEALAALPFALLAGYAGLRFASTLFAELRDLVFSRVARSTVADFTLRVFAHLHSLPARFHMQRDTDALTRDVERGTAGIGFLLGVALFTVVPTLVEVAVVTAILVSGYSGEFTLILLATFLFYAAHTVVFTRRRAVHQRSLNDLDATSNRRLVDSLANHETVKLYGAEGHEAHRFREIVRDGIEAGVRNQKALTRLRVGQSAIVAAGVAAVMLLAGQGVMAGALTVGDLILLNAYVIQVCLPLNSLGFVLREAGDALANAGRVVGLLAQEPEVPEGSTLPALAVGAGEVRFERVSFGYEPARQVLWDVDFTIPPARTVALVGGSGSGKSTLARLLLRFHEAGAGRVLVDGQDVRQVSPASLRGAIGLVPQDASLFDDTIARNIGYGRIGAAFDEIVAAARAANVHDFIMALPQQYDTVVGERGVKLSAGEKQRIAIARALLRNPPILVFDEATSALDARSERAIQEALERLSRRRTTLLIAHRLSTVVNASEILVLEHGRIVERGRHEALLARGGIYAQMWSLQQQQKALQRAGRRTALQQVNLANLVAAAIDGLRSDIDARNVHLYTTLSMGAARVNGDPGALQGLVWDLVAHAIQVSAPGSRVEVRLERDGPEVRLVVSDAHGAPLSSVAAGVELPREPNVLGTDRPFDLADLRCVAEEHGGRFTVRHAHQAGATYVVTLPLRAVDAANDVATPGSDAPAEPASLAGRRLLVVDDHEDAREVLSAILEEREARIDALGSGRAALEYLRGKRQWPDLLLCDIGLPDIDGYALMREVRALEAERGVPLEARIPAIALTGYSQHEDRTRALLAGFQLHLAKPVDPRELLSHIAMLLTRGGNSQQRRSGAH